MDVSDARRLKQLEDENAKLKRGWWRITAFADGTNWRRVTDRAVIT